MQIFAKTQVRSLILALILALGVVQGVGAQPSDPAAVLIAWEKVAFGSTQDIDAALALMTDDAVLRVVPPPAGTPGVWIGKAEIRQALQFNKEQNVKRENVGSPRVEGNKVTITAMVTNNYLVMLGVAPVEHTTEAEVEGGKIKSYTSTMAPSERGRVAAAAAAYQQAHQPAQPPAGMPRTGGEQSVPLLLLIVISMLTALVGLGLRRTAKSNSQ